MVILMQSRIFLLTLPISDFIGLISLQVGLSVKLGLWSFSVIKGSFPADMSTLSSILSFPALSLLFSWMARVISGVAFL